MKATNFQKKKYKHRQIIDTNYQVFKYFGNANNKILCDFL